MSSNLYTHLLLSLIVLKFLKHLLTLVMRLFMNKVALITGASRGIGKAVAYNLAKNGYDLYLVCHKNMDMLTSIGTELSKEYSISVHNFCGDISDSSFVNPVKDRLVCCQCHNINPFVWCQSFCLFTEISNFYLYIIILIMEICNIQIALYLTKNNVNL